MKIALYPGTFDPITKGHLDVINRALRIFDRLVVAVALNPWKKPLFSFEERVEMAKEVIGNSKDIERIEVTGFEALTVDFAHEIGATSII